MRIPGRDDEDLDEDEADDDPAESQDEITAAFAAFGLRPEGELDLEDEFYLWPENVPMFKFWLAVQTQWIWHEGQRVGMNYAGVEARLRHWPVAKKSRTDFFQLVGALEGECLQAWSKERK